MSDVAAHSQSVPLAAVASNRLKIGVACANNLLAVSSLFMTQSIFLEISRSYGMEITSARLSFGAASLFYALAFPFLGPLADAFDSPRIAATGLLMLAGAVFLASCATGFPLFVVALAGGGISAALIAASMFPYVSRTSSKATIGVHMGSLVAAGTMGVVLGRTGMGLLSSALGWQTSFRIVSLGLLFMSVVTYALLVEKGRPESAKKTGLGRTYADSLRLLSRGRILILLLAGSCLFWGFLGMVTFLTYRLIAPPFCFPSEKVGWMSLAGATALIAPFAAGLSRRIGMFRTIIAGMLLCLLAVQVMGWFPSVAATALGMVLLFLGVYACQPLLFLLIGRIAPRQSLGGATSLYIFFCTCSGSLAAILLGPVWSNQGWRGIVLFCSASMLVSLFLVIVLASKTRPDLTDE